MEEKKEVASVIPQRRFIAQEIEVREKWKQCHVCLNSLLFDDLKAIKEVHDVHWQKFLRFRDPKHIFSLGTVLGVTADFESKVLYIGNFTKFTSLRFSEIFTYFKYEGIKQDKNIYLVPNREVFDLISDHRHLYNIYNVEHTLEAYRYKSFVTGCGCHILENSTFLIHICKRPVPIRIKDDQAYYKSKCIVIIKCMIWIMTPLLISDKLSTSGHLKRYKWSSERILFITDTYLLGTTRAFERVHMDVLNMIEHEVIRQHNKWKVAKIDYNFNVFEIGFKNYYDIKMAKSLVRYGFSDLSVFSLGKRISIVSSMLTDRVEMKVPSIFQYDI
jgi:hypothetical protein